MRTNNNNTRGVRNNNPLNIRIGNTWLGEVQKPTESAFEQFVSMEYGLRAGFCILRRYINKYQHNTIAKILHTWAPSTENNTEAYIDFVSKRVQVEPDDIISYSDTELMCRLVHAMAIYESAIDIPFEKIKKSYNMA